MPAIVRCVSSINYDFPLPRKSAAHTLRPAFPGDDPYAHTQANARSRGDCAQVLLSTQYTVTKTTRTPAKSLGESETMHDFPINWDINFRANLRLWPEPVPNIVSLIELQGQVYDESAFIAHFPSGTSGRAPTDTRAVRNTFEALSLAGLAMRSETTNEFLLTDLGRCLFSFLGHRNGERFANESNLELIGKPIIRGLSIVNEARAIWHLFRGTANVLTNEELNRAMAAIHTLADVPTVAGRIMQARQDNDPTAIGPRIYHDDRYAVDPSEQRKAMNPQFLLYGGGGILIDVSDSSEFRRLRPWAIPLIDGLLHADLPNFHGSTSAADVLRIARSARVPYCVEAT